MIKSFLSALVCLCWLQPVVCS